MSRWHRENPEKPLDNEPYYWIRSMKTSPKIRGTFTVKCPHCAKKGEYCWRTDHDKENV